MGPINLDIGFGNLRDAWDKTLYTEVEGFKNESNAKCFNETLIKEPPNVLLFILNRVQYDIETKGLKKNLDKF